jgi:iron complex outermembrane receptor protein
MPSIQISTTYYNTRFKDRIQSLAGGFGAYILQAANLPAGTVVENPSPDFVSETIASVGPAQRFIFADPADVSTYIVISPQNIARVKTSGVDFALNYSLETEKGHLGTTFSATRILKFEEQSLASLPIIDRVNTVFYPPKMRLRAGANWSSGPLDTSFFINYVGAYRNNFVVPSESVSNYTTIDSQMKVDLESIWSGTEFSIIARNLFDKDPPYVSSANFDLGSELGYDPANADPIGRLISVQLTKRW